MPAVILSLSLHSLLSSVQSAPMSVSYCKEVTVTLSLLSCCQGLEIVDRLYNQCCGVQGTPHYPLLLSLFSLALTPYTQLADPLLPCQIL